jgi:uncharacterized repeat protein (TIGR01451 family)
MKLRISMSVATLALSTIALLAGGCGSGCCDECEDGSADLALTKGVDDATPNVGDTITFTVTLSNSGPDKATDVRVLDLLPTGLTYVSAVASQGTYAPSTGVWTVGGVSVGTPLTLVMQANVASTSPQTNTATIGGVDQVDPDLGNNTASVTEIPSQQEQANLGLGKGVSNATPNVGDTITFTVTLSNSGPDAATGVQVLDLLPPGLSYVSSIASQGSYDSASGLWTVGTLAVSTPQTLTLVATVVSPESLTNTATIGSVDHYDPDTGDNAASATATPQLADLSVDKSVSNATPNVGDQITFTVTVTNSGPDAATNVQVQDLLPSGLSFFAATPSQGMYDTGSGLWTVGTVASGTPQTLTLVATVVSSGSLTNTATIGNADQFDPETSNNMATATETPQRADLSLSKNASDTAPLVEDTITFTVTLTNEGPDTATNVLVQDVLPVGLSFSSATASQGSYDPGSGVWSVGTVAFGTPQTLAISVTVVSSSPQTNTAAISAADQFDADLANNAASSTVVPVE